MSEQYHNPLKTADSSNLGNHLNGLSNRRDRALMALLEPPSIAAAREADVGESTLRQWLREDENFQAMLRLVRHSDLTGRVGSLESARKDQEHYTSFNRHRNYARSHEAVLVATPACVLDLRMPADQQSRRLRSWPQWLILPGFLLLQASLLFYRLDLLDAWGDEVFTLRVIGLPWNEIPGILYQDIHPPLYYVLAKAWVQLGPAGDLVVQVRALSAVFCLISTVLIYFAWLRRTAFSTRVWFLALWTLSPTLLMYSRMARSYSLQLAVSVVALRLAWKLIQQPKSLRAGFLHGLGCATLLWVHYLPGLAVTAGAGLVLAYGWWREKEPKRLRSLFFASLVTAVLYAPWLPTLAHAVTQVPGREVYSLAQGPFLETSVKLVYWFTSFTFGEAFPAWAIVLGFVTGPAVVWLLSLGWQNRWGWLPFTLTVAVIAYIGASAWVTFAFVGARLLFLLPFYLLWLLRGRSSSPKLGSAVCLAMLVVSAGSLTSYFQKEGFLNHGYLVPFREIADHIRDHSRSRKSVILIDGYNADAAPLIELLRGDFFWVEIRGELREARARKEIRSGEWNMIWFLRRGHDVSPDHLISRLEDEIASKYEGRQRFFVPFSDVDRWALNFLGRDDSSGHHYQLTEFRLAR
jgi:hypothetical protein